MKKIANYRGKPWKKYGWCSKISQLAWVVPRPVPMSSVMASASAAELRSVLLELSAEAQGRLRQLLDPDGGVPAASKSPMPDWRCLWAGNVAL